MLLDLLPGHATDTRTTRTTNENHVVRQEHIVPQHPYDTYDTNDTKTGGHIPPRGRGAEFTLFAQVDSDPPESVRHLPPSDDPSPEQLAHARRMLVDCPSTGGKLHCWYCSRCGDARTCSAWRSHRRDVEFYKNSEEPLSLRLVEEVPGVLQ